MRAGRITYNFLFFSALFLSINAVGDLVAQPPSNLFEKIEPSVVKVECMDLDNAATGFIWHQVNTVVSALHVVDGCKDIQIYYPVQRVRRSSNVLRVYKDADLVLLQVNDAPNVPVLSHSPRILSTNEIVHTLGFPFNVTAINSFTFNIRYGGGRLRDNISSNVIKRLEQNGYPIPDLHILKLGMESLLPGLSGSPIFDEQGQVVAVGNGGLEEGAINISWGIPAENLDALLASTVTILPEAPGTRELFAAELQLNIGETISAGNLELVRMKNRSFQQLVDSADDIQGLQQLTSLFSQFNPGSFRYDIYQDLNSGATVVLPEGTSIEAQADGFLAVKLPTEFDRDIHNRYQMVLQIRHTASLEKMVEQSVLFEEYIKQKFYGIEWQLDPQWSYPMPITRFDGLMVRRKAAVGFEFDNSNFFWITDKYMFETLAYRDKVFIGLAVINTDNTPQTTYIETICQQGLTMPECPALFRSRRAWAQMVLGIQLTSFNL